MLAAASDAIIIGFQVRPSLQARKLAENEQIDIRLYSVIYKAIEELRLAMEGMLSSDFEEKIMCNIEVRDIFKISKLGTIAGCMVLDGALTKNTAVRVIRDGVVVYTGKLSSLKRFKDDVNEVKKGFECGMSIENFNDIKVGDIIEGYTEVAELHSHERGNHTTHASFLVVDTQSCVKRCEHSMERIWLEVVPPSQRSLLEQYRASHISRNLPS